MAHLQNDGVSRWFVRAQIVRWVDDHQPGFVECRFSDRFGHEWSITEKLPVVTTANHSSHSHFPQPAFIACTILSRRRDDTGREIVAITTEKPWGIEASDGTSTFEVFAHHLTEDS